ncbi:hypothetical protein [Rummeliibacillus stabekisii]|uniref:Uncharacterized protein n=1 Tax=Rummeliibacillus stabekisii TaxID=241244 RepID=A0A143HHF3_9BACL|nr:hypothetical protein [Rummeliibacillus stabekisii]AMX01164.1 hypothetical protein ATY39_17215 [Rummeliibacillus stabekisii]
MNHEGKPSKSRTEESVHPETSRNAAQPTIDDTIGETISETIMKNREMIEQARTYLRKESE